MLFPTEDDPMNDDTLAPEDVERMQAALDGLNETADRFGKTLVGAFARGAVAGRSFEDVLRSVGRRFVDMALSAALQPAQNLVGNLFTSLSGSLTGALGRVTPFAAGGIVSRPTYFPMSSGLGLMGEAGSEAIMPLARGPDGRLGVRGGGGGDVTVNVSIAATDVESFRRSEAQIAAGLARAVARGRRAL
jgi:phage-related minor tail protein